MIEAVGQATDAPSLSAALTTALERTLSLPFEKAAIPGRAVRCGS